MRCMMCGDDMVLTEAIPAEMGGVHGFETHTHQCPSCHGTECRLIFVGGNTPFIQARTKTATIECAAQRPSSDFADTPKENSGLGHERLTAPDSVAETTLLTCDPPPIGKLTPLNAGNAPGQAWVRAVEKFRSYEADLHQRAEKTKNANGKAEPSKASDRITVAPNGETRLVDKFTPRAARDRLQRQPDHAAPLERGGPDHEGLRRFDEFWDKLVPRPNAIKPAELSGARGRTSVTPLTGSASLVAIEPTLTPGKKMRGKRGFKKMLEKLLQHLEPSPFRDK